MAVAAARLSPAANLLRNSRLFALPWVLSKPGIQASSYQVTGSESATSPYPTHAAIETPLHSLNRGDWGLKRPLPLKSTTKSGTPVIRVNSAIDTIEHITDFESAADHVLNLRKWQELNFPITLPEAGGINKIRAAKGVFTENVDNIAEVAGPKQKRWRYAGPFLSGMTVMEFEAYLKDEVRRRKDEFKERIRAHLLDERLWEHRRLSMEQGSDAGDMSSLSEPSDGDIVQHMRKLRSRPGDLGRLISEFLDLPDGPEPNKSSGGRDYWEYRQTSVATQHYREVGPPKTHPSAGLSYVRTTTHARNDPIRGPMGFAASVPGRIMKPKRGSSDKQGGKIGVAGFVADTVEPGSYAKELAAVQSYTPRPGGNKIVVRPLNAAINADGTMKLTVRAGPGDAYMYDGRGEGTENDVGAQGSTEAVQDDLLPSTVMGAGPQMVQLDRPAYREKPRFSKTPGRRFGASAEDTTAKDTSREKNDLQDLLGRAR